MINFKIMINVLEGWSISSLFEEVFVNKNTKNHCDMHENCDSW